MSELGKLLLVIGGIVAGVGLLLMLASRIGWLGRLPGDIAVERKNFAFYFPIVTCLVVSAVLTLIFWIMNGRR
jgi:hypothetical protein